MNSQQKTIKKRIVIEGIGLHTGLTSKIELSPLKDNQGIIFENIKPGANSIKANWKNLCTANLCTKIKKKNFEISTIEHLMFSLSSLEPARKTEHLHHPGSMFDHENLRAPKRVYR